VPVEEQPYEVPGNWVWVKLKAVFEQVTEQVQPLGDEQYIGLEHLIKGGGYSEIGSSEDLKSKKVAFKSGDVLYGKLRPYLNKHALVDFEGVASTDILVLRSQNESLSRLLNFYLGLSHVIRYANENSSGINLPRVSPKAMANLLFPLPPLNEQKRIADKVERLLDKINQAKQLIEEAKATFELRRAAILDKAFRGELTRKWREERFRTHEQNWEITTIGDVCSESFYGPRFGKNEYSSEGIPTIRTTDMSKNGEIILKDPPKVIIDEKNLEKFRLKIGDLLVTRTGSIGTMAVFNEDYLAVPSAYLIRFRFIEKVSSRYLFYYLMSPKGQKMMGLGTTAITQPNINAETIKKMPFLLPSFDEQIEIVKVLDSFWDTEQILLNKLEKYDCFDKLEQSILLSAFSGKLGTNELNELKPII